MNIKSNEIASLIKAQIKNYSHKIESSDVGTVVTVGDDGGSSGRLRKDMSILPPGDIRNCIAALADDEDGPNGENGDGSDADAGGEEPKKRKTPAKKVEEPKDAEFEPVEEPAPEVAEPMNEEEKKVAAIIEPAEYEEQIDAPFAFDE